MFKQFFLQLANDIITTVIIPKPKKGNYSKAKCYWLIALLECPSKLISKLIANMFQSDMSIFDITHPLQFGGHKHHSMLDAGILLQSSLPKHAMQVFTPLG